jgi:hypothetical protein
MKIKISSAEGGSMLIATVVISAIIGLTLATYLNMVQSQHLNVMRSQSWNTAIPACEAGIEEALAHLNSNGDRDRATNGWTLVEGVYVKTGSLSGATFETSITSADSPVITSYGTVPAPLGKGDITRAVRVVTSKQSTGMRGLVAKGAVGLGPGSIVDSYDSRVTASYNPGDARSNAFVGAVNGSISGGSMIKGNAATGPGYTISAPLTGTTANDLSLSFPPVPTPFTGGFSPPALVTITVTNFTLDAVIVVTNTYPSPTPVGGVITNKVIRTNTSPPAYGGYATLSKAVTNTQYPAGVGTVTTNVTYVSGKKTAPADGTYYGLTITYTPTRYAYYQIDSYSYGTTFYVYTNLSYSYSLGITNTVVKAAETYAYVLDSDNYKISTLNLSGTQPRTAEMVVRGDAKLWVTDSLAMTGNARITILAGATLKIYVGDGEGSNADIKIAGNGVLNQSGDTEAMGIYGLSDANTVKVAGNGTYIGTVYAPDAQLQGKGGGSDVDDFQGAAIVGSVAYNGHFNFHYDEKLGDNGGITQWKVKSWSEF